uniref:NADH-ubiquinone oxidoreductase chain 6 n=1 Tax=Cucujoidea sp. 35 KM-2017 TaxID=2219373 RepID=A0A346RFX9_9CUCU|nr:NADH dehydrogenase subunit 6 [Cucujoidea sp. 35 KM-2017]
MYLLICYISIIILFINHPVSMGMLLLIQTIMTSLMIGMLSPNFWFSYILLLIMIGGMLIIFMYMTSIASNEKFKGNYLLMIITPLILLNVKMPINFSCKDYIMNKEILMMKFFNYPNSMIMILMIIYLLITMIASIKICKINKGPLRQMF